MDIRINSGFQWIEWLLVETGQRTEMDMQNDKKDERNEKAKMYHLRHSLLTTTPQHSLSRFTAGYQPMSKRRKWTKEACANPLVKRSLSWCLVSILTRVMH